MPLLLRIPAFRNAYLLRGLAVWAFLRMGVAAAQVAELGLPAVPAASGLGFPAESVLLAIVATSVLLDAFRRNEHLFLANLGITPAAIALCGVPLALLAECLVP